MNTVFIGGSRRISRLGPDLKARIDRIVERQLGVLVGDANGADKAVQKYLSEQMYPRVTVFCTAGSCRNNLAGWPVSSVKPPHRTRDFEFFTAKDAAMAQEADAGLMLWDGESVGTMVNVARLAAAGKPTVVYLGPQREFQTVKSRSDLERLLGRCEADARHRIDQAISDHVPEFAQPAIF